MSTYTHNEVVIGVEHTASGPCVVIRIYDDEVADAYADAMRERSHPAHGLTDQGFADDAEEIYKAAERVRADNAGAES